MLEDIKLIKLEEIPRREGDTKVIHLFNYYLKNYGFDECLEVFINFYATTKRRELQQKGIHPDIDALQ